jgi:zinc finger SWIM domain-containing protein 3
MVHYLQKRAAKELVFSCSIQLDAKDQITNLFWCDARSRIDYQYFGDVVCFDYTYKVYGYDRPFVVFLGLNHQDLALGFCTMILSSLSSCFFKLFKESMAGNVPHLILTDGDENIVKAVREVSTDSVHRL